LLAKRADAQKNRDRILTVAREAFAEERTEISMAEISRRAGVGMATLYRNFPGRRELLEALYTGEVDAVCEAAKSLSLVPWLHRFAAFSSAKRPIAIELLKGTDGSDPVFNENRARVLAAGEPLLLAAQQAGEVRDDLTLEQVLDMVIAIATLRRDPGYLEPILQTALDGLRPNQASISGQRRT
jgi:AcrR family transcriptional regulator